MFCMPSWTVAAEPSLFPTRRFAAASNGIVGAVKAARPIPIQLACGCEPATRLSAPKPISAIEDAAIPAPIAMPNSTTCHPIPSQARARARRTSPLGSARGSGDAPTRSCSTLSTELLVVDRLEVLRLGLRLRGFRRGLRLLGLRPGRLGLVPYGRRVGELHVRDD